MYVPERYPYPPVQMNPHQQYPMSQSHLNHYYPNTMYPYQYPNQPRQYMDVDVTIFEKSVTAFQKMAIESSVILKKFADRRFAKSLMTAAQVGNQKEVDRLIKSVGTSKPVTAKFTPSGIQLTIDSESEGTQCCTLKMYLKWGN
jgi:hypothetical protein